MMHQIVELTDGVVECLLPSDQSQVMSPVACSKRADRGIAGKTLRASRATSQHYASFVTKLG